MATMHWSTEAFAALATLPRAEIILAPSLAIFTFRCRQAMTDRLCLTQHIRHRGHSVIGVRVGRFDCRREDVMMAPAVLAEFPESR